MLGPSSAEKVIGSESSYRLGLVLLSPLEPIQKFAAHCSPVSFFFLLLALLKHCSPSRRGYIWLAVAAVPSCWQGCKFLISLAQLFFLYPDLSLWLREPSGLSSHTSAWLRAFVWESTSSPRNSQSLAPIARPSIFLLYVTDGHPIFTQVGPSAPF